MAMIPMQERLPAQAPNKLYKQVSQQLQQEVH